MSQPLNRVTLLKVDAELSTGTVEVDGVDIADAVLGIDISKQPRQKARVSLRVRAAVLPEQARSILPVPPHVRGCEEVIVIEPKRIEFAATSMSSLTEPKEVVSP